MGVNKMIIFMLAVLLIYSVIQYILYKRIIKSLVKFPISKKVVTVIYWLWAYSYVIYMMFSSSMTKGLRLCFAYLGSFYLGFLFYLILFFCLSYCISKLKKWKIDFYLISIVISLLLMPIGYYFQSHSYVKEYSISTQKDLSKDWHITLVSDIHLGDLINRNQFNQMVDKINATDPDIILIAGDVIDSNLQPVLEAGTLDDFHLLKSRYGVYVTFGNHDLYTDNIPVLKEKLE